MTIKVEWTSDNPIELLPIMLLYTRYYLAPKSGPMRPQILREFNSMFNILKESEQRSLQPYFDNIFRDLVLNEWHY